MTRKLPTRAPMAGQIVNQSLDVAVVSFQALEPIAELPFGIGCE